MSTSSRTCRRVLGQVASWYKKKGIFPFSGSDRNLSKIKFIPKSPRPGIRSRLVQRPRQRSPPTLDGYPNNLANCINLIIGVGNLYLFPYYWLNCLYHGHILNTLDEKVFHRQVSALIGGHWVGPRTATALAAHFRSSKGTHGHFLNAHASIQFLN